MINFINWLYGAFVDFINVISYQTVNLINSGFRIDSMNGTHLGDIDINIVLFSDTPILSTNIFDLLLLVFSIFYTVMFVVIIYKIIKKVLIKITGWHRW